MAMKKFQMLNLICESCSLTSKEKLVAQYFIYKSNQAGECYPSVSTIAKHCGVSERTIQRATKKLQERNFIFILKRFYKGKQSSNEYKLNTSLMDGKSNDTGLKESNSSDVIEQLSRLEILSFEDFILQSEANLEGYINNHINLDIKLISEVNSSDEEPVYLIDEQEFDCDMLDPNLTQPHTLLLTEEINEIIKTEKEVSSKSNKLMYSNRKIRLEIKIIFVLRIHYEYNTFVSLRVLLYKNKEGEIYLNLIKNYKIIIYTYNIAFFIPFLGVSW